MSERNAILKIGCRKNHKKEKCPAKTWVKPVGSTCFSRLSDKLQFVEGESIATN